MLAWNCLVIPALTSLLVFVGFALLFGGVVVHSRLTEVTPPGGWVRWWLGGTLLMLLGLGLDLGSTLLTLGFTAPDDVLAYLTTTGPGRAAVTTALGAVLLLAAQTGGWPRGWMVGMTCLAALVTVWGLAGQGHGAEHGGVPLRVVHALHLGVMAVWTGGVGLLFVGRPRDWAAAGRAFTPLAVGSVVILAVGGLFMGLEHAGPLERWTATGYGRLLLFKVAIFAAVLLTAIRVRRHLTRSAAPRVTLALELGLLLLVLGVTSVLANSVPPGHG